MYYKLGLRGLYKRNKDKWTWIVKRDKPPVHKLHFVCISSYSGINKIADFEDNISAILCVFDVVFNICTCVNLCCCLFKYFAFYLSILLSILISFYLSKYVAFYLCCYLSKCIAIYLNILLSSKTYCYI